MPRKNSRPAAKKRQAKMAARIKSGQRRSRVYYDIESRNGSDLSLGVAVAAMGVTAFHRFDR